MNLAKPPFEDREILSIPIRADVTVRIAPLPPDLTTSEAAKIARVILALPDKKA